jgi:hypothetical protein
MNPLAVIVLAIGKRRSGKSLLRDLLSRHRHPYRSGHVGYGDGQQILRDFVPGCLSTKDLLRKRFVYPVSQALTEKMKHEQDDGSDIDPKKLFIMDDLGYDAPKWVKNKDISSFHEWASYPYFFLLTLQYPKGIPPALRTNVDYTFIPGTEHDESKILTITTPECFDLR